MSLGETNLRPTAMLFRNLAAMEVEESIRANPLDGVVLLVGCDKTTPALLMGAASVDLPTIVLSGGPMLNGRYRGENDWLGYSCLEILRGGTAGTMSVQQFMQAESGMSRSAGHCMTMGTASTMACMAESLGVALPENAGDTRSRFAPPRVSANDRQAYRRHGRRRHASVDGSHPRRVRERHPRQWRDRRIDQRGGAPACTGRARGHRSVAGRLGPLGPRCADPRRPTAIRYVS